jgi:hypothetical protein
MKSQSNINTGVSVVFPTKRESKCQNELFLKSEKRAWEDSIEMKLKK